MDAERQAADLQFRMNKKIAQLTKVIYQLNCRCEDNDAAVRAVVGEYESEVAQVMADARTKISTLRDELTSKKDEARLQKIVQTMTSQHEAAKQTAMREFEAFKLEAAKNEQATKRAAEERITQMTSELQKLRTTFLQRQQELADTAVKGKGELSELLARKDREMEQLVVQYNEKYKAMLAQQISEQEQLEARLRREKSDVIAQLEKQHAVALAAAKAETMQQTERAERAEAADRKGQEQVKGLDTSLRQALAETQTLTQQKENLNARLQALMAELAGQSKQGEGLNANVVALQRKVETLEGHLSEKDAVVKSLTEQNAKKQTVITALENEIVILKTSLAKLEQALTDERGRSATLTSDGSTAAGQLREAQQELAALKKAMQEAAARVTSLQEAAVATSRQHTVELEALTEKHAAATRKLQEEHNRALDAVRSGLTNDKEGATQILRQQHAAEMEQLRTTLEMRLAEELNTQQRLFDDATTKSRKQQESTAAEVAAAAKAEHDRLSGLLAARDAELTQLRRNASDGASSWERQQAQWQQQFAQLTEDHRAALAERDVVVAELNATIEKLRRENTERSHAAGAAASELATANALMRTQLQDSERNAQALAKEVRGLNTQVADLCAAHSAETERLRQEHTAALAALSAAADRDGAASQAQQNEKHASEIKRLREEHAAAVRQREDQISKLRDDLARAAQSQRGEADTLSQQIADLKCQLEAAKNAAENQDRHHRTAMESANSKGDELRRGLEERIQTLQRQMDKDRADAQAQREQLATQHAAALDATVRASTAELQAARDAAAKQLHEMATLKDAQRSAEIGELNERAASAAAAAAEGARREREELEVAKGAVERELRAMTNAKQFVEGQATALREEIATLKSAVATAKKQGQEAADAADRRLRESLEATDASKKAALAALRDEHAEHVLSLNHHFDTNREEWNSKQKQLKALIADLEYRVANRESRREDVEKINELLRACREKDAALLKAHQDMKQYKLDLMNKETTYNKVFGRQPTVSAESAATISAVPAGGNGASSAPGSAGPKQAVSASVRTKSFADNQRR
jgi:chromosome segregation ATPase